LTGKVYRVVSAALGLLLLGVGVYAWFFSGATTLLRYGAGAVLVVLGANAIWCAWRARPSWLSRIGPLP
jgi:uncharacterized membrane protein HdeD (DUF308 family)